MEEIKQSVFDTMKERVRNPFFGFMFIAWLYANWDNLLFLIFSKRTIEEKISALKLIDYSWFFNFLLPLSIGFIICLVYSVFFPYFLYLTQTRLRSMVAFNKQDDLIDDYERQKDIIKLQVEVEDIKELHKAEIATRISQEKAKKKGFDEELQNILMKVEAAKKELQEIENKSGILSITFESELSKLHGLAGKVNNLTKSDGSLFTSDVRKLFSEYLNEFPGKDRIFTTGQKKLTGK